VLAVVVLWLLRQLLLEELRQPEVERLERQLLRQQAVLLKELPPKISAVPLLLVPLMTSRRHSQPSDSPVTSWPCSSADT
jgi:hypothetical protein